MKWTKILPTEPGWYWLRWYGYTQEPGRWAIEVVKVIRDDDGELAVEGCEECSEGYVSFGMLSAGAEWQGPLVPQEETP